MEGIQFVTDDKGKKVAVQIDLARYGTLWENIYDQLLAEERAKQASALRDREKTACTKRKARSVVTNARLAPIYEARLTWEGGGARGKVGSYLENQLNERELR